MLMIANSRMACSGPQRLNLTVRRYNAARHSFGIPISRAILRVLRPSQLEVHGEM